MFSLAGRAVPLRTLQETSAGFSLLNTWESVFKWVRFQSLLLLCLFPLSVCCVSVFSLDVWSNISVRSWQKWRNPQFESRSFRKKIKKWHEQTFEVCVSAGDIFYSVLCVWFLCLSSWLTNGFSGAFSTSWNNCAWLSLSHRWSLHLAPTSQDHEATFLSTCYTFHSDQCLGLSPILI